jgi:sigma-B regulation protein RsbU (phosphoserine phosphatase)
MHDRKQIGVYAIYRNITEKKKVQGMQEERRMARRIQLNFLPKSDPEVPGYHIAGKSIPAMNVGGDYYDFIWLDDHRLALVLGDVSGNGLAASLIMANLQATIRSVSTFETDPATCLQRANRLLYDSTDARMFVSLFYGILDFKANKLCYANAGQDIPVHFSHSRMRLLNQPGIAMGMVRETTYKTDEIVIGPGDRILIYSDGVCEAMNADRQEFGDTRVKEMVLNDTKSSPRRLIDKIFAAIQVHFNGIPQNDDMTLVILSRNA